MRSQDSISAGTKTPKDSNAVKSHNGIPSLQANTGLPLALRPREAAKALGIGERHLWSLTNRGEIPHIRLGRAVLYPLDGLREWLDEQSTGGSR